MTGNTRVKVPIIAHNPPTYKSYRAIGKPGVLDGNLDKPFWETGVWIEDFHDIEGDTHPKPWKKTRVKVLWDDEALWVGAQMFDDTIWATETDPNKPTYVDNDFEIFLAPQDSTHRYYEIETNALNTVWDLLMERAMRDVPHRIPSWDVLGLQSAVKIDGVLNDPSAENRYWSIEVKLPWFSFRECGCDECYPSKIIPTVGEIWRMNFSRVEYEVDVVNNKYVKRTDDKGIPLPEHNWLWAPTGVIDAHMMEMWGYLVFTENGEDYALPREDDAKWLLRRLYYQEHLYCVANERFCDDAYELLGDEAKQRQLRVYTTPSMFEGIVEFEGDLYHIDQDGRLWKNDEQ